MIYDSFSRNCDPTALISSHTSRVESKYITPIVYVRVKYMLFTSFPRPFEQQLPLFINVMLFCISFK